MQVQEPLVPLTNAEFVANVERWSNDRNLIKGSSPDRQFLKLSEEIGEYYEACEQLDRDGKEDALGDADVVLSIVILQCGANPVIGAVAVSSFLASIMGKLAKAITKNNREDIVLYARQARDRLEQIARASNLDMGVCRAKAWNEIKDRKGWTENGIFYKDQCGPCGR